MRPLDSAMRRPFEKSILEAREAAESACRAALGALAVNADKPHASMSEELRDLRRALRAKERQLGNGFEALASDCAYEQWHRMLFARFLAENDLLRHPSGVPVTLEECAEIAKEEGGGDEWTIAARFAEEMLPGIFRSEDPAHRLRLAPEGRKSLEQIIEAIPQQVFTADDSLGWVYQFWQSKAKREVNESERKIGGADLAPVTQMFTENYMVRFLLENSLGAWWAARHHDSPLLEGYEYLRLTDDGAPAAGAFEGWPESAAEVTIMDPCMGSGHFLVVAFEMLRAMRMEEEGLSEAEAGDAVIRDNLFGLELDPRCTQLGAFAVAFAAWKAGGYRPLPLPNIACSGIGVAGQIEEWRKLAGTDEKLIRTLERLHALFVEAPTLGSLIDPRKAAETGDIFSMDYADVAPLLERVLKEEGTDPVIAVFGGAAASVARAADLLSRQYTLVVTNPPYLGRSLMTDALRAFSESNHWLARSDLATCFLERSHKLARRGTCCLVLPQNWLFLVSYRDLRCRSLQEQTWYLIARLGSGAFETVSGEVVQACLCIIGNAAPPSEQLVGMLDSREKRSVFEKASLLRTGAIRWIAQRDHARNPDCVVTFEGLGSAPRLSARADSLQGLSTSDMARFRRVFWEAATVGQDWEYFLTPAPTTVSFGGREEVIRWSGPYGAERFPGSALRGDKAWGKKGVAVSTMGSLPATLYLGEKFSNGLAVLRPHDIGDLPAIWALAEEGELGRLVRTLNVKLSVANATIGAIPFDRAYWQKVAEVRYPHGLPVPHSDDPTQWLFQGQPNGSERPLQVAVARLLGYRWPEQSENDGLEGLADADGVVSLPAVRTEKPAAERLRALLADAYGDDFSTSLLDRLLRAEGARNKSLDAWLREEFFISHCKLFHNRPFIWHIWDGLKEGFSVLVNYHRLDKRMLERLTHTYLGWWITNQRAAVEREETGAEPRLKAALQLKEKLELIAEGEPPYDIYVRWKDLSEQPVGWDPDLSDGVRLNVRPFVEASILRHKFTVNWKKDRGKDPDGSERINDRHHTRAEKLAAREAAGA
jgi:hypothetical protein